MFPIPPCSPAACFGLDAMPIDSQQEEPAEQLIVFCKYLPIQIPRFRGDSVTQAANIRLWMEGEGSEEIQRLERLDLTDRGLGVLPPEIGLFRGLKILELEGNGFETLPPEIGNLVELVMFNAFNNKLTTLPPEIGNLTKLERFYLRGNCLRALPPEIGNLVELIEFDASQNQIGALPIGIGNCTKLKALHLRANHLQSLPPEIGNLGSLLVLDVQWNRLRAFPAIICDLVGLARLVLSANRIGSLPPEIGNLVGLEYLDFSNNQHLATLPVEIRNLVGLKHIDFSHTPVEYFITRLGNWAAEFERVFPRDQAINAEHLEYWESHIERVGWCVSRLSLSNCRGDILQYLEALQRMKSYQRGGDESKHIILHVERVMQLACKNLEFKAIMLDQIADAVSSCSSRVAFAFMEIETQWQLRHKELTDEQFKSVVIRASRSALLQQYIFKNMRSPHQIDILLEYYRHLRDVLESPAALAGGRVFDEEPLYRNVITATQAELDEARAMLLSYNDEQLLARSEHWRNRMAQQYPEQAAEIDLKYVEWLDIAANYYRAEAAEALDRIDPELQGIFTANRDCRAAVLAITEKREEALAMLGASAAAAAHS